MSVSIRDLHGRHLAHRWGKSSSVAQGWGRDTPPFERRVVWDLCGGSGAWARPYADRGYPTRHYDLPSDVRVLPFTTERPWGILAAPPCSEFSRAKRAERDYVKGMEVVNACLRLVFQYQPAWWALENPWHSDLTKFLGPPDWTFHPWWFGDPWTKPTGLWGVFTPPSRRTPVKPTGSAIDRSTAAERAITPPGFAIAFCEANP